MAGNLAVAALEMRLGKPADVEAAVVDVTSDDVTPA